MKMVESFKLVWVMIYASIIIIGGLLCNGCFEEERNALLQIKESINSPQGSSLSGWYDVDCCQWEAVECSPNTSTVVKLFLHYRRDPNLPEKWYPNATLFAQLKDLQELYLQGNQIAGFTSHKALQNLKHLQKLNLRGNSMEESSQLCWGKMQSLDTLYLSQNELKGQIPRCWCEMHSLTKLDLSDNHFHGHIDACFGNLSSLKRLDISLNSVNGTFPSWLFGNLTNIEAIIAANNRFDGKISFSVFANLSKLSHLDLSYNDLEVETETPTWIPSFNLHELFLHGCNLNNHSGNKIPSFISTQYQLLSLDLSQNSLVGNIPSWLLYNFTSALWLARNSFSGSLPQPTGNVRSKLGVLDISENLFHGPILPRNSSFPKLTTLTVRGNNFTEMNSHSLSTCSSLQIFDASRNGLSGELSAQLPVLTDLKIIVLGRNHFQGRIPEQLCQMKGLSLLDISGNNFSGVIPTCLNINSRALYPNGHDVVIGGQVLHILGMLDISGNQLTGTIPSKMGDFTNIISLNISNNLLTGPIPKSLGTLMSLESLDLSHNHLFGQIPQELVRLTFLVIFAVSFNNLSGPTPKGNQFYTFENSSYVGNPYLCGVPLSKACSSDGSYISSPNLYGSPPSKAHSSNVPQENKVPKLTPPLTCSIFTFWFLVLPMYRWWWITLIYSS